MSRGGKGELDIVVAIKPGYHVNSVDPGDPDLIASAVRTSGGGGIFVLGTCYSTLYDPMTDVTEPSANGATSAQVSPSTTPPIPTTPSALTLGARIQRVRLRKGISVRDLADRAGVNKNTVLRLEKGFTPSYATLTRVCAALGIHIAQLTQPEPEEKDTIALHLRESGKNALRQLLAPNVDTRAGDATEAVVRYQDGMGKPPFAADEKVLLSVLGCRLPGGRLNAAVLELFGESDPVTHPGEEMVFCLRGIVKLTVAGRAYRLCEGDAAAFWSAEQHSYGPWEEADSDENTASVELPVQLLSVWIDTGDDNL